VGEVMESHVTESSNVWAYGFRYLDSFRVTDVAVNTPPGIDALAVGDSDVLANGAFASRHPSGAQFVYVDGHVTFVDENIDFDLYQNMSTIAGAPEVLDVVDKRDCTVIER
jgi:prepilin-type processing-associated H-X9-DG protein